MIHGRHVAAALVGTWRTALAPSRREAEAIARVAPQLVETGAAGLAWRRLAASTLRVSQAWRLLRLHALEIHDLWPARLRQVERTLVILQAAGIEPILVKGWSAARLYAEPMDRPLGDIDLCVGPADWQRAQDVLDRHPFEALNVDLHRGVADLDDRGWNEVWRRSRLLPLGESKIRVLGPEDHLRHLCLHFMRHGAWRPLWLCDVAAAMEASSADFDWDYFQHGQRWLTDWALCAISLAGALLEALPAGGQAGSFLPRHPAWLEDTVLSLWSAGGASDDAVHTPLALQLKSWSGLREAMRQHWPNPIRAAFKLRRSPFTRLPRRLLQAAAFGLRAVQVAADRLKRQPPDCLRAYDLHRAR